MAKKLHDRKLLLWLMACIVLLVLRFLLSEFYTYLACVMMIMAVAATALNLIMGYGGMVSFGHGALVGVGGYTVALLQTKIGIPPTIALITAPFVAALISFIIGYFCVRLHGILFSMLTLAFSMMLFAIASQWYSFTGGDNGIVGLPPLVRTLSNYYVLVVVITMTCLASMWRLINSPFGITLRAIQQNPERPNFIGISVRHYRLAMFTISGFFCGIAGGLLCFLDGQIFPGIMFWSTSGEILIMVLLGGMLSFFGPFLGAALVVMLKYLIGAYTIHWMIFLGLILFGIILFLPEGILFFVEERVKLVRLRNIKLGE
jgi:branched-chain amino acid transport system permease protein